MVNKRSIISFLFGALFVGIVFSFYSNGKVFSYEKKPNHSFINPVVISNLDKHFIINFQPLREDFLEIQKKYEPKTHIYFSYFNNAAWIGINEREIFTSASVIKVPLAMTAYKAIEEGKLESNTKYTLEEVDLDEKFGELYKIGPGKTITVEQLKVLKLL
jgi:beta-lactamase class A